ncbi:MAG TPA: YicC/YloC family endoribonuclease, partial [Gemmatimonadales bacterium]|nr:YicC/YloC family endoribonuclease [Gemmatimonadales bacterium]
MALSMTGFGMAEGDVAGRRATVEIRTVNHRHFNLSARLPGDLGALESELREGLRKHFDRGHLSVTVRWVDEAAGAPRLDWAKAEAAVAALRELRDRFHLAGDVTVELIARQADLFARGDDAATVPWSALAPVVDAAAAACVAARRREGAVLTAELLARLDAIDA